MKCMKKVIECMLDRKYYVNRQYGQKVFLNSIEVKHRTLQMLCFSLGESIAFSANREDI
jgi:hypothetical protein